MECAWTETTWTEPCKRKIETEGLSQTLAGYSLTDSQKTCVYDKLYSNYTPATFNGTAVDGVILNTYIPDCKKNSSHTVLIIIVLIILGAIVGTVFYLKSKGVIKF